MTMGFSFFKRMARGPVRPGCPREASPAGNAAFCAGKLADAADLLNPAFGAAFLARFDDSGASLLPRKRWEYCWLSERCQDLYGKQPIASMLGLAAGREPLIYHFAHLSEKVVATDLYDTRGAWRESRLDASEVPGNSPFPYPRDRLTVRNMDMRSIDYPARSFDLVWSCSSVEHVSTLDEFIQVFHEIHRVLKPGGHALITTEFSLDEPYLLPGVLSLWRDCALFTGPLEGLSLAAPVDLDYRETFPGNRPTARQDSFRLPLLNDLSGGPSGICLHVGYARLVPLAFVLEKTGPQFRWPEQLDAPAWYRPYRAGLEIFRRSPADGQAIAHFRSALKAAETPGARLHCYRQLIEACVHAGEVRLLDCVLRDCAEAMPNLPDDDDALDTIAYVAAGQGRLAFARRCWERALRCPAALPSSRLRIRCNQLEAELRAHGPTRETRRISALADAAWCEALDFHGPEDPQTAAQQGRLDTLRREHRLGSLVSSPGPGPARAAGSSGEPVTARNPCFDLQSPPHRPVVYLGDHLAMTRTVYGHKMQADTRSQVGACFLMDGYWEEWIVRHLKDYVKPGMRALDLGANMGFYTLLLCELVGPLGHVTAFEPWPAYHEILRRNIELNGYGSRCTNVGKAVHAATGKTDLAFFETYGTGSLTPGNAWFERDGHRPTLIPVETVSLDDYLREHPQAVDFIKIDVDGSEPAVFSGMRSLLETPRPLAIFCEFCPGIIRTAGTDPQAFLEQIRNFGFAISQIAPDGIREFAYRGESAPLDWQELLLVRGR